MDASSRTTSALARNCALEFAVMLPGSRISLFMNRFLRWGSLTPSGEALAGTGIWILERFVPGTARKNRYAALNPM